MEPYAWSYQKWDPIKKEIVPYPASQLSDDLQKLCHMVDIPGVIHRFHATRPMSENYQSEEVLVILLTVAQKGEIALSTRAALGRLAA